MQKMNSADKFVTPLMLAAFSQAQHSAANVYSATQAVNELSTWGYYSVFDIVKSSPQRFIRRHRHHFSGQAETLYQNALSYATQLVHAAREQGLRDAETLRLSRIAQGEVELPGYADLFPEPWDNFCKPGALEALNSRAAYLLELYQFAQQMELDASEGAISFVQRRPDIPLLMVDHDNASEELPALQIVNEVLSFLAAEYIDKSDYSGKPVYQVLGETHYPYALPFSLPTQQVTLGLKNKKTSLARVIQSIRQQTPAFCSAPIPGAANSALVAAAELSDGQMSLLTEPAPFPGMTLTKAQLAEGSVSGSTTEILTDTDLASHGYVLPQQQGASGPDTLSNQPLPLTEEPFDLISVICQNARGEQATAKLRATAVLTCQRLKRRLKPFSDSAPYPRTLKLHWVEEDNRGIDLTQGPWFGEVTIEAQVYASQRAFIAFNYQLALSSEALTDEQLSPQAAAFFAKNYGITLARREKLEEMLCFIEQTKSTAEEIEQAIAWGDFSPVVTGHIAFANPVFSNGQSELRFPLPFQAGARYLNGSQPEAVGIDVSRPRRFTAIHNQRFDRLQRLMRLQRWLGMPYHELDWLINCVMMAEGEHNLTKEMNLNTLRALGLYRHLNQRYNLSAEVFSSFIHTLSPFSVSGKASLLDRVFNQPQLFDQPFIIDNQTFDYTVSRGDDARTVKQICAGLKISQATFRQLAGRVNMAFGLAEGKLNRSLAVISALYRLVMLPKLFSLTPEQGILLIDALGIQGGVGAAVFAGTPQLSPLNAEGNNTTEADVLDVILTLEELSSWLQTQRIKPEEYCLIAQSVTLPAVATENSVTFFNNLLQAMPNTLLAEPQFMVSDIPLLPDENGWMSVLAELVTENGIVKPFSPQWGESDENWLKERLTAIVREQLPDRDVETIVSALAQVIMQAKTAQDELVSSAISREYGAGRDSVAAMLQWCGSSISDFISKISSAGEGERGHIRQTQDVKEDLLAITYHLAMNALLVKQLRLKAPLLDVRLRQPAWLGLEPVNAVPLSLKEVWSLASFRQWATASQFSEEELIDYLAYANQAQDDARNISEHSETCAELLANILQWDAEEILLATGGLTPAHARSVPQIDWLRRIKALSEQTGLSVTPLLAAAQLPPFPSYAQITHVGEAVIAATQSLTEEY